jgi:hypothetical protein
MDNLWITYGDQLVEWTAELTPAADDPAALFGWLRRVLTAGERDRAYEVHEAPLAGYRSPRDGALIDHLERRFAAEGVVDVGHFASSGMRAVDGGTLRVAALLAYADDRGEVVEAAVENLGGLLRRLRPGDVTESGGLMVDCPPIDLAGPLIDVARPDRSRWHGRAGLVRVRFTIRSDIWFPWVIGFLAPPVDVTRRHDNRPLAMRHTPRLNAFLAEARAATLELGGRWELDPEIRFALPGMISEEGVRLDVAAPHGLVPPG